MLKFTKKIFSIKITGSLKGGISLNETAKSFNFLIIFESFIIKPEREKHIRDTIKKVFNKFHEILPSCYSYRYGGSFKRYNSIKNYFEVDVYFVGHFKEQNLLNNLNRSLKELERIYKPFQIARNPPYMHAIPAIFKNDVELDCLAAIKLKNGFYKIPEYNKTIKINPEYDEAKLKNLNQKNDGMGTKLIRLLKKWNSIILIARDFNKL